MEGAGLRPSRAPLPKGPTTLPDNPQRGPRRAFTVQPPHRSLDRSPLAGGLRGCTKSGLRSAAAEHLSPLPKCTSVLPGHQPTPWSCHPRRGKSPAQLVSTPRPSSASQEQIRGFRVFKERETTAANKDKQTNQPRLNLCVLILGIPTASNREMRVDLASQINFWKKHRGICLGINIWEKQVRCDKRHWILALLHCPPLPNLSAPPSLASPPWSEGMFRPSRSLAAACRGQARRVPRVPIPWGLHPTALGALTLLWLLLP